MLPVSAELLEQRIFMSVNVGINASQRFQTIAGFGTSMFSQATVAPYDAPVGSTQYQNFLNDYVNDLGATIVRINFQSDVLPAKPAVPLGTDLAANIAALNFNSTNAAFFGNLTRAIDQADGNKLQVVASIWSPPAWMKANDSLAALQQPDGSYNDPTNHLLFQNNDPAANADPSNNLDPDNLLQFARYCAAYVAGMEQTYGIQIVGLSIQNELMFNESYDSCSYYQDSSLDPTDIQYRRYAQAVKAVGEEFERDGITTALIGPESIGPDGDTGNPSLTTRQVDYIKAVDADTVVDAYGKTAADYLGVYAIHGWSGDGKNPASDREWWAEYEAELADEPIARASWQTEESGEAMSWLGANNNPLRGALGMGMQIHDTLVTGDASAYLYWQTADGNTDSLTPVLMDSTAATVADPERSDVPQWKYLTFKHWSHFVVPGAVRIGTTYTDGSGNVIAENPAGVNTDAYIDDAGKTLTVELTNIGATAATVRLTLNSASVAEFDQAWLTDATNTWANVGPVTVVNGVATITLPAYSIVTLQGSTAVAGSIRGTVFNDSNGNGKQDSGETGLVGIEFYNDANNNGKFDPGELTTTTTDSTGNYIFAGLSPGNYKIRQMLPAGSRQTTPANNFGWTLTLSANQTLTGNNFGEQATIAPPPPPTGESIAGNVFNDSNGNGAMNAGETGIPAIVVYDDLNNDGKLDNSEPKTLTDRNGNYSLASLSAGNHKIREIIPAGWRQTTPTNNYGWTIALSPNQALTGKNFGEQVTAAPPPPVGGSISGVVFNDANGDLKLDNGELGLASWTLYIDSNNDGILDNNELTTQTKSDGTYTFSNLAAGTYLIRAVRPAGWSQTTPTKNFGQHVTISKNQNVTGIQFGEMQIA
jgi:O-glycosyl hydrolase